MTIATYPDISILPGIGYNQKWSITYFNQSQKTLTGASIDMGLAATPLHTFDLTYQFLRDAPGTTPIPPGNEFRALLQFFASQSGSLGRFQWDNVDDNQFTGAFLGFGDGTTTNFLMTSAIGLAPSWPIGPLKGTISFTNPNVYIDTGGGPVHQGSGYSVVPTTPGTTYIEFAVAPPNGSILTYDANYYYWVKFVEDSLLFEKFKSAPARTNNSYWSVASVKMQTVRPNA